MGTLVRAMGENKRNNPDEALRRARDREGRGASGHLPATETSTLSETVSSENPYPYDGDASALYDSSSYDASSEEEETRRR